MVVQVAEVGLVVDEEALEAGMEDSEVATEHHEAARVVPSEVEVVATLHTELRKIRHGPHRICPKRGT